ncbi:MAG: alpha-amylase family glycosyl hydrolase [Chloroflexales bacterium]|nr:alpha-amylase family glycosyl hydrolase [Chloroflexales bacterium]
MHSWSWDAVFYHIYPLGLCGAPPRNDFTAAVEPRLAQMNAWIDHLCALGVNALYLGPVFESSAHGYDTADYYVVDRRLGNNATLTELAANLHARGVRLILDGVFHHVGRDFWAFRDLQQNLEQSLYRDWFASIDFGRSSPYGDPFAYDGWNGHYDLVKLNLHNPDVRSHLFAAVRMWIEQFNIDGLRLDVAEMIDLDFLRDLAAFCRNLHPNFWLVGEVIHGDYRHWANANILDSTTNYEVYKGLYSSHNDRNYFEIAYSLNRQFGEYGMYRELPLYHFVDNHDVNRIASTLHNPAHLYPVYALLFTMPGVPAIYYGSEWGIPGMKQSGDDSPLRPALTWPDAMRQAPHPDLAQVIAQFVRLRHQERALRHGSYQQLFVAHEQLAFARRIDNEYIVVALNATETPAAFELSVALPDGATLVDLLEPQAQYAVRGEQIHIDAVSPRWVRILAAR